MHTLGNLLPNGDASTLNARTLNAQRSTPNAERSGPRGWTLNSQPSTINCTCRRDYPVRRLPDTLHILASLFGLRAPARGGQTLPIGVLIPFQAPRGSLRVGCGNSVRAMNSGEGGIRIPWCLSVSDGFPASLCTVYAHLHNRKRARAEKAHVNRLSGNVDESEQFRRYFRPVLSCNIG